MAKPCVGTPAISREILYEALSQTCLSSRNARPVLDDPIFPSLQFRSHQIFFVFTFERDELQIPISRGGLERAFNCSRSTVQRALENGWNTPTSRGRHPAMHPESEAKILQWVGNNYEQSNPVTRTEILHYCERKFNVPATRGWVDSFILRHQSELIEKKILPQEEPRLQVPRVFLDETIRAMEASVQNRPADLIFNLDEVGVSEWENRNPKRVVVPRTAADHPVHHRVSRNLKHISIITCISASGACLTPYMVSSQATRPVRQQLEASGLRFGRDLILMQRTKAYINGALFADYIRNVFLPHVARVPTQENLQEEEAVLLMDNCPSHLTQEVLGLLTAGRVRIVTFTPHTTHLFQVLDLTLFGLFKRRGQFHLPLETDHRTAKFIQKVYHDFRQTMIDPNIRAAFTHIGITFYIVWNVMRVRFNEITLRQTPGFMELWEIRSRWRISRLYEGPHHLDGSTSQPKPDLSGIF
jgi:hypothetical protein